MKVAPLRGRGLKPGLTEDEIKSMSRSLTGAWIETIPGGGFPRSGGVAPLRGRGLKQPRRKKRYEGDGRSLTGAWIETVSFPRAV